MNKDMTSSLVLSFFGTPQVILPNGQTARFAVDNSLLLLAYLAFDPHKSHRREELAALFYPDHVEKQASQNLRQTLMRLRRTLADQQVDPPYLLSTIQSLQFNPASHYWLDVSEFEALIDATQQHRHRRLEACRDCMAQLAQAVELYRGEFLASMGRREDTPLVDWAETTRDYLQRKAVNALQTLARHHLARQQFAELTNYTTRLLQIDALDEDALRLQMQALALRGERNQALKRYRGFRDKLLAELDVEPAPETVKLARAIQSGQTSHLKLQHFQRSDRLLTFQKVSASALPNTLVPFVDREVESKEIARYLASQDCRLITLVGPGGIGKSRLAMRAAADDGPGWTDGAWIVSLDGVAASDLEATLANALGIATNRHSRVRAQLYDHLREKEILIVLDNFERLMDRADLVKSLLDYAPYLKVMVTSREQLGIRGEQVILVRGLDYPDDNDLGSLSEEEIEGWPQQYSAVQLFVENARRVRPGFMLSPDNLPAIVRICQLVDGLPLAVELASVWVRIFSCDEILARLEQDLDLLRRRTSDVPDRHASMRAVFEYSWEMLPEEARAIVAKLSVFRGGFTLDAAEKIMGATPRHLAMLSDKSLLRRQDSKRLELYPPLRQYALEKLAQDPNLAEEVARRHCTYYLAFAAKQAQALNGKPNGASIEIQRELGNIDAAWRWAAANNYLEELIRDLPDLARYSESNGAGGHANVTRS